MTPTYEHVDTEGVGAVRLCCHKLLLSMNMESRKEDKKGGENGVGVDYTDYRHVIVKYPSKAPVIVNWDGKRSLEEESVALAKKMGIAVDLVPDRTLIPTQLSC